ncbi:DUF2690 domain-containing protein [Streptomyces misionensis]|uniref:DUF2690 domain-containing protein n=1 Tax=Streptomyces misionensis TaxID=67331 RepID=UPI0036A7FBC8
MAGRRKSGRGDQRTRASGSAKVHQAGRDIVYHGSVTYQDSGSRGRYAVWAAGSILGLALLVLAIFFLTRSDPGHGASASASLSARVSPTASCDGDGCLGVDPATTVCQNDAGTALSGRDFGVLVELRYSPRCHAAWAKMSGSSEGDWIQVFGRHQDREEYRQQYGADAHTAMVGVRDAGQARACALVASRGTVCATTPASPGPGHSAVSTASHGPGGR